MVYGITPKGIKASLGFVNLEVMPGDKDYQKIEVEDPTPDGGLYMDDGRALRSGRRVKTEHFPEALKKVSGSKVPDFDWLNSLIYVSDRFKSIVEAIEPGIHQFIPFQIVGPKKAVLADMWFMVVCNRLDTVDRENTTLLLLRGRIWTPPQDIPRLPEHLRPDNVDPNVEARLVFNLEQIGDHHLWFDKHLGRGPYLSDKLADALMSAEVTGANLTKLEAV